MKKRMAFDGAFLKKVRDEIYETALGARIDRISQPSREEIVLGLRWKGGSGKLFLSAGANSPRIHFTKAALENPKSPPMFCMFLRKHLGNAKLVDIQQMGMDRILHLIFETSNELGDMVTITVAIEIMGRHSNIILFDQNHKIMDAVKRIDEEMSSVRQILPGMSYVLPPAQDKLNLLETSPAQIVERLRKGKDIELSKALMHTVQGISPLLCREISYYVTKEKDPTVSSLTPDHFDKLQFFFKNLAGILQGEKGTPTITFDLSGKPLDFSLVPLHQYGSSAMTKTYDSYSELLDSFYSERDLRERMKQRSNDLLKFLANTSDRLHRKLALQQEELLQCTQREKLKEYGDLINSNLYRLQKGDQRARVTNYFDPSMPEVDIELDPSLSPSQNAQKYYTEYRKADTAEKMLRELLVQGQAELTYMDSVFDALVRARTEAELNAIREELAEQGYVRSSNRGKAGNMVKSGKKKPEKLPPIQYRSTDGFLILVGRNNLQNDRLTLKESRNYDIWFHTQKIPGSHTIVVTDGKREVPNSTLEQAAIIAAYNSQARESSKVPVDYTYVKNIKKPNGAKPGMVIYETYETAIVNPNEELVHSLRIP